MDATERRIRAIEQRNKKVEIDKAWETSWTRIAVIGTLTYVTVVLFLIFAGLPRPYLTAAVPAVGFVLSTLTLPFFKKLWMK